MAGPTSRLDAVRVLIFTGFSDSSWFQEDIFEVACIVHNFNERYQAKYSSSHPTWSLRRLLSSQYEIFDIVPRWL